MAVSVLPVGSGGLDEPESTPNSVAIVVDNTATSPPSIVTVGIGAGGVGIDLLTFFGTAFRSNFLRPFFGPAADAAAAGLLLGQLDITPFLISGSAPFGVTPTTISGLAVLTFTRSATSNARWRFRIRAPHSIVR